MEVQQLSYSTSVPLPTVVAIYQPIIYHHQLSLCCTSDIFMILYCSPFCTRDTPTYLWYSTVAHSALGIPLHIYEWCTTHITEVVGVCFKSQVIHLYCPVNILKSCNSICGCVCPPLMCLGTGINGEGLRPKWHPIPYVLNYFWPEPWGVKLVYVGPGQK